jgi:general stress protein 26
MTTANTTNDVEVERLLLAARATMGRITDWWAATPAEDGGVTLRVVVPIPGVPGEDPWTQWFATKGSSRKAMEIRRFGRIALGCQHDPDRAYVALFGRAFVVEDRAVIRGRWNERWRTYFPGGPDDPDTAFVGVDVERIELCVPGSTPEPFGIRHASIERDGSGWKLA